MGCPARDARGSPSGGVGIRLVLERADATNACGEKKNERSETVLLSACARGGVLREAVRARLSRRLPATRCLRGHSPAAPMWPETCKRRRGERVRVLAARTRRDARRAPRRAFANNCSDCTETRFSRAAAPRGRAEREASGAAHCRLARNHCEHSGAWRRTPSAQAEPRLALRVLLLQSMATAARR